MCAGVIALARHPPAAYHGPMALLPSFATLGHGPPVVLLHGSGGGARSFAPQLESLASLGFRAIAWDMPGYGQSAPIEPYGFKGLAERGAALIEGAVAHFECFNRSRHEEGDHLLFIGQVEHCDHRPGAAPLLFHGGRFYTEHPL